MVCSGMALYTEHLLMVFKHASSSWCFPPGEESWWCAAMTEELQKWEEILSRCCPTYQLADMWADGFYRSDCSLEPKRDSLKTISINQCMASSALQASYDTWPGTNMWEFYSQFENILNVIEAQEMVCELPFYSLCSIDMSFLKQEVRVSMCWSAWVILNSF